ncbi:MAG TPA: Crp/Fnr family transcriptional regulator [Allosphingosinicella sp.]|nr:Crp/Fnr family transcriptional regulator [Allosphingosinicella sp.]
MHAQSSRAGEQILMPMVRKFERRAGLAADDREALLALPYQARSLPAGAHLVRDGDRPQACALLLSGFAFRHKITGEGGRQVIALHVPGDFLDLQNSLLEVSDHNVQTLTEAEIAFIARDAIRELALARPAIGVAMWIDTLVDSSIFREWVVNVGRRDAYTRVCHILCEFSLRLEEVGLAENHRYELPMTQEQLADALGLTPVHVNRVLRQLGEDGLIVRTKRVILIQDWDRMRDAGDFTDRYLHYGSPLRLSSADPRAAR